jgi:uncharacterized protein YkwD
MIDESSMNRFFTALLLAAAALTGCANTTVQPNMIANTAGAAELNEPIDFENVDFDRMEEAIVRFSNEVRKEHDRGELQRSRLLARAARKYARRMVEKGFLAHEDPTSERLRTPADRIRAAGGANPKPAENIADVPGFKVKSGQPYYVLDPDEPVIALEPDGPPIERHTYASYAAAVVDGWMHSPGHRRNLLNPDALQIGVGAAMYHQNEVPSFVVVQKFQLFETLR